MKLYKILPLMAMSLVAFNSCDDQVMEWGKDPNQGAVTGEELPLPLAEKITRYAPLKTYAPDFLLGAGIDDVFYMTDEQWRNIVNENFEDVTVGYAMKHGPMVRDNGTLNFGPMDAFVARTKAAGLSIYGHTLAWHSNQNATYLNGLIAPQIIPASGGSNLLNVAALKDNSFSGWPRNNPGDGITIAPGLGLTSGSSAVKLVASGTSTQPYNLQLGTPNVTVVAGHNYEVSFFIKSDITGKGRISFSGLSNNYPYKDWLNNGGAWTESFATSSQWTQIKFRVDAADISGPTFGMNFDLGYLAGVTYYMDIDSIKVTDLDAPATPAVTNLISNGDFETNTTAPWGANGSSVISSVTASGGGFGSSYAMVFGSNLVLPNMYEAQLGFNLAAPLTSGKTYTVSFMVKANKNANLQFLAQTPSGTYPADYSSFVAVTPTWTKVTQTITPTSADRTRFIFQFGTTDATFTIDDIVVSDGLATPGGSTEPTIIEKTPAEKATIIGAALEDWIKNMVGHYKNDIFAWDVVNEPIRDDNGDLRNGTEQGSDANDFFSWIKYLGKDYGVMAFKYARQYGNPTDKLFINDYNLEQSAAKLDGLLEYVEYIEDNGATVDGIATQMHVSYNSDRAKIVDMFTKMAATGKLIKVSELDVRLGTATPTAELQAQQADMYKFIIDKFREIVPAAQQYGITIWGITDKPEEHVYWLPNESPCLWDANYGRKHAYKGTADGLAGKDVSVDFTGLLNP